MIAQPIQNVPGQIAAMRPGLDNPQNPAAIPQFALRVQPRLVETPFLDLFQPLSKLKSQQFTEQTPHVHAGIIIPATSDNVLFRFVISTIWTIERQLHEACKRNDAPVL